MENFHLYPLNRSSYGLDIDDLHLYKVDLDRMSKSLFVDKQNQCSLEAWQIPNEKDTSDVSSGLQGTSRTYIFDLENLKDSLSVCDLCETSKRTPKMK
jgi:hypothetical protein